ncbi:hypothetical protein AVEN_19267-1 [Araneus ventricosus]|uniref:Uncharacterized protein n=1 Tax=Araneus ventricosus TaxID=182803 RepID=A0A4Y2PR79_ARAVE|nr:hypothetical protein AVEN_19267-1 [Araneus ventricosus]
MALGSGQFNGSKDRCEVNHGSIREHGLHFLPSYTHSTDREPIGFRARGYTVAREIGPDSNCVRRFLIPAVNFRSTDYVDLIVWQACNVTPLAVLRHISSHELRKMIQNDMTMGGNKFPSHTQAVGRIVNFLIELDRRTGMDLSELH